MPVVSAPRRGLCAGEPQLDDPSVRRCAWIHCLERLCLCMCYIGDTAFEPACGPAYACVRCPRKACLRHLNASRASKVSAGIALEHTCATALDKRSRGVHPLRCPSGEMIALWGQRSGTGSYSTTVRVQCRVARCIPCPFDLSKCIRLSSRQSQISHAHVLSWSNRT